MSQFSRTLSCFPFFKKNQGARTFFCLNSLGWLSYAASMLRTLKKIATPSIS